jgi:hypothetical protein
MRALVLDGQHSRESIRRPVRDHAIEHARAIGWIGERQIVRALAQGGRERERILPEDP